MQWRVCVLTAPRPEPTLKDCLASVTKAGWTNARVYAEPDADVSAAMSCMVHGRRLGIGANWMFALRESLEHEPDAILMMQDDAILAANCREYVERSWPDQAHVLWLYRGGRSLPKQPRTKGWLPTNSSRQTVYGALAVAMKAETARRIDAEQGERLSKVKMGFDVHLQMRLADPLGMRIYQHQPSLVQHIGRTSILHPGMFLSVSRRATDDWIQDAKELMNERDERQDQVGDDRTDCSRPQDADTTPYG